MKVFVSVAILFLVATCSHARGLGQLSNIEDTKSAEFLKILNRAGDHASKLVNSKHVSKVTRLISAQQQVVGGLRYSLEFELTQTVCLKIQDKNIDECDVKPELWINATFLCACAAGFMYQVSDLTVHYFKYKTSTKTKIEISRFTPAPDLHICPTTNQVFNFEAYNAKYNTSLGSLTYHDVLAFQGMMTVDQLFEFTPSGVDLLKLCFMRRPESNAIIELDRHGCRNVFNVTKFFVFEYMCYSVSLNPGSWGLSYDTNQVSYALTHPNLFFELALGLEWNTYLNEFKILAAPKSAEGSSIAEALTVSRGISKDSALFNRFVVKHYKISHERLPPPYDSMCRNYVGQGFKSARACAGKCMGKRILEQLGRYWYVVEAFEPFDKLPVSTIDHKNKTFERVFERIYVECQALCAQNLHICPSTNQVFNFEAYNAKYNTSLGNLTYHDVLTFQGMMTVAQLLEFSPSSDDLLEKCYLRRPQRNHVKEMNRLECNNVFSVKKYFVFEYMCYVVSLKPGNWGLLYDTNRISYALNHPALFYELVLSSEWHKYLNEFKVLAAPRSILGQSIAGAHVVSRGLSHGSALFNRFVVKHYKISHERLPPPYDSMCRDYFAQGFKSSRDCAGTCMGKRILEQLDRHWYGVHSYYPIDKLPVSTVDAKNKTFASLFERIYADCQAMCAQRECKQTFTITMVSDRRRDNVHIMLAVETTNQPSFYLMNEAELTVEPYLIFVMSCIGSWFGLSVLSFNPVRWLKSKNKVQARNYLKVLTTPTIQRTSRLSNK
ncbi:hypothetical protein HDE_08303 [Halotydeus destructor]|nr:hypothetical protein HDE_08303 [Halotydeus destructor]